jgi:flagellar biosynthesis protein FlhB
MNREQDLDRNLQATPYKLDEARKRGQVARSADLQSMAVLAVASVALFALARHALRAMALLMAKGFAVPAQALDTPDAAAAYLGAAVVAAVQVLAPLLFVLIVAVLLVGLAQTRGLVFSADPIKPDVTRLNPVAGFKKLFSVKLLYEGGKSLLKLLALGGVGYATIHAMLPGIAHLRGQSPKAFIFTLLDAAASLSARLVAVLALFALVDVLFARWEFLRNLRMSRRELEDEHKHREGDPRIRARLRELRQEFMRRMRSVASVPKADVLITNPTHISVALRYEHGVTPAPQLIAKGAGGLAQKMRDVAFKARVPIVQNPALARSLYKEVAQDAYLPERWYPQVARILVWLQASRAQAQQQRAAAAGMAGGGAR